MKKEILNSTVHAASLYATPNAHPLERLRNVLTPYMNIIALMGTKSLTDGDADYLAGLIKKEFDKCVENAPAIYTYLKDCETFYIKTLDSAEDDEFVKKWKVRLDNMKHTMTTEYDRAPDAEVFLLEQMINNTAEMIRDHKTLKTWKK